MPPQELDISGGWERRRPLLDFLCKAPCGLWTALMLYSDAAGTPLVCSIADRPLDIGKELVMGWAEIIVQCLKINGISLVAYVPDISIDRITRLVEEDDYFHLVSATREEEAMGIAAGAYAVGRNSAVFMQSSGFGNIINVLGSLCIPSRIPIPMFINLRGQIDEFNIAQVAMGRATRPILDLLGLPHYTLTEEEGLEKIVSGAIKLCHSSRQPLGLCLTPLLHGGKLA